MLDRKIFIIGGGNMGTSIAEGLLNDDGDNSELINIVDSDKELKIKFIKKKLNFIKKIPKNIKNSLIIIAVKPQNFENLAKTLNSIQKNNLIISIMAGVTIEKIRLKLKNNIIIRAMPNLNSAIKKGYTVLFGKGLNKAEKKIIDYIFSTIGELSWVRSESKMNLFTAITGSGPGFIFYLMEKYQVFLEKKGIDKLKAKNIVCQLFDGSANYAKKSKKDFALLRENVSSKGGTTEAGCKVFDEKNFENIINEVFQAAIFKANELGDK
jgi:pyrroline-5-carboxylate reductase